MVRSLYIAVSSLTFLSYWVEDLVDRWLAQTWKNKPLESLALLGCRFYPGTPLFAKDPAQYTWSSSHVSSSMVQMKWNQPKAKFWRFASHIVHVFSISGSGLVFSWLAASSSSLPSPTFKVKTLRKFARTKFTVLGLCWPLLGKDDKACCVWCEHIETMKKCFPKRTQGFRVEAMASSEPLQIWLFSAEKKSEK